MTFVPSQYPSHELTMLARLMPSAEEYAPTSLAVYDGLLAAFAQALIVGSLSV